MSLRPGFSIIMPTFNRAFCICEAVDSVLMQNYPDFELMSLTMVRPTERICC